VVPNLTKWWFVSNQTSGAFTLKFKTPSGSASTAIPQPSGCKGLARRHIPVELPAGGHIG
jgi:hypothetical protein